MKLKNDLYTPAELRAKADGMASAQSFDKSLLQTQDFKLTSYHKHSASALKKNTQSTSELTIYIEGDGHTWINRTTLSSDPTPYNPLALKLALLDTAPKVAYLARPCQYTPHSEDKNCQAEVWSGSRFSESVIQSMNQGVDLLKKKLNATHIHLVGFSGGAAVAVLIAAIRSDVLSLRTVGGDLDHEAMSKFHKTTPLQNSLNPKKVASKIAKIPQIHFIGEKDPIIPDFISENFVNEQRTCTSSHAKIIKLKNLSHHEGWEEKWPALLYIKPGG